MRSLRLLFLLLATCLWTCSSWRSPVLSRPHIAQRALASHRYRASSLRAPPSASLWALHAAPVAYEIAPSQRIVERTHRLRPDGSGPSARELSENLFWLNTILHVFVEAGTHTLTGRELSKRLGHYRLPDSKENCLRVIKELSPSLRTFLKRFPDDFLFGPMVSLPTGIEYNITANPFKLEALQSDADAANADRPRTVTLMAEKFDEADLDDFLLQGLVKKFTQLPEGYRELSNREVGIELSAMLLPPSLAEKYRLKTCLDVVKTRFFSVRNFLEQHADKFVLGASQFMKYKRRSHGEYTIALQSGFAPASSERAPLSEEDQKTVDIVVHLLVKIVRDLEAKQSVAYAFNVAAALNNTLYPGLKEKVSERLSAMGMTVRDVIMVHATQHVRVSEFMLTDHGLDRVFSSPAPPDASAATAAAAE